MKSNPRLPGYDDVLRVVYKALDELNLQRPRNQRISPSPNSILFGENGDLNSLELSNFIVLMEQMVQEMFRTEIDLTEDDPFSLEHGHMRTVDSLTSHISNLMQPQA
jgi:hypothetical protein